MDNKEKFITLWEEAGGERAEKGILKKIAKKLKVPEGTIRRWKSEHIKKNKVNVQRTNGENERSGKEHKRNSVINEDQKEILKVIDKKIEKSSDLNEREKLFCHYYIRTFNGTLAVKKAGYSEKFPDRYSYTLLQKDKIKKYINELQDEIRQNVIVNMGNVIDLMKRVAFADIGDFVEFGSEEKENGNGEKYVKNYINFKDIEEVDGQLINEVSVGKDGIKVKLVSKEKALEFLAKYMDYPDRLAKEKHELDKERTQKRDEEENTGIKAVINEIIGVADGRNKNDK